MTNSTDGGEGIRGYVPSEETRKKLSDVHRGAIFTKERREKISKSLTGKKKVYRAKKKTFNFNKIKI